MAQDTEGNILVAHSTRVFVHRPNRELLMKITSSQGIHNMNVTWGGASLDVLFIVESESGTILKIDWHCRGWLVKSQ